VETQRVDGQEQYEFPERLCDKHFGILRRAGLKGRVHARTGKRFWLVGWDRPEEEGQPSVP